MDPSNVLIEFETIDNPRPFPSCFLVINGSKIFSKSDSGIPIPKSITSTCKGFFSGKSFSFSKNFLLALYEVFKIIFPVLFCASEAFLLSL